MLKNLRDYLLVKNSGYFDPRYYFLKNPDLRKADVSPLMHYVRHGWKEGRYPSLKWETMISSGQYQYDPHSPDNPLIEYIKRTRMEKRASSSRFVNTILSLIHRYFPDR